MRATGRAEIGITDKSVRAPFDGDQKVFLFVLANRDVTL